MNNSNQQNQGHGKVANASYGEKHDQKSVDSTAPAQQPNQKQQQAQQSTGQKSNQQQSGEAIKPEGTQTPDRQKQQGDHNS